MITVIASVAGYLFGSIPFGIVIARLFGLGDLRQIGSGNIGATNVLRTGNKRLAAATLALDAAKGAAGALVVDHFWGMPAGGAAGFFAVVGHIFPLYLGFKGGKGVATYLGTLLAITWPAGLAACATWLVAAILFRYSSLAAIIMVILAPIWTGLLAAWHGAALMAILSALVLWRHRANIGRLRDGTEPKIGKK